MSKQYITIDNLMKFFPVSDSGAVSLESIRVKYSIFGGRKFYSENNPEVKVPFSFFRKSLKKMLLSAKSHPAFDSNQYEKMRKVCCRLMQVHEKTRQARWWQPVLNCFTKIKETCHLQKYHDENEKKLVILENEIKNANPCLIRSRTNSCNSSIFTKVENPYEDVDLGGIRKPGVRK